MTPALKGIPGVSAVAALRVTGFYLWPVTVPNHKGALWNRGYARGAPFFIAGFDEHEAEKHGFHAAG